MLTSLRKDTYRHLQLGPGMFLKNFPWENAQTAEELKSLLAEALLSGEYLIGATRGGGTFQCKPEIRRIDADGSRYADKSATLNDCWTVKLTGTLMEITPEGFASALMGAEVTTEGSITTLRVKTDLGENSFIPRLCWVGDTSQGFALIELKNALNVAGVTFSFGDKGEGTLPFEYQAHTDGEDDYAPFSLVFLEGGK